MRVATGQRLAGQPVNKDALLSALLNAGSLLIGFPDYREPAQRLARAAGIPYADALIHHFPDGETRLRLAGNVESGVSMAPCYLTINQ